MNRGLVVDGTRPEADKMATVTAALSSHLDIETAVLPTGQHRELLQQALSMLELAPDYDSRVMIQVQQCADLPAKVLGGTTENLATTTQSLVLVHGNATTSMATALASFYQEIPVGHVDDGLRTYAPREPCPEELNRHITGRLATLHLVPTPLAQAHLFNEVVKETPVRITGTTIVVGLLETLRKVEDDALLESRVWVRLDQALQVEWRRQGFVLVTAHRRENLDMGINEFCQALGELASTDPGIHTVYPVHPNPVVSSFAQNRLVGVPNIHLPTPFSYRDFSVLFQHCRFAMTNSGGIQEEAPILGKPVLVAGEVTERPEAVSDGAAASIGAHSESIVRAAQCLIDDSVQYQQMAVSRSVFGDGRAGVRITGIVADFVNSQSSGP